MDWMDTAWEKWRRVCWRRCGGSVWLALSHGIHMDGSRSASACNEVLQFAVTVEGLSWTANLTYIFKRSRSVTIRQGQAQTSRRPFSSWLCAIIFHDLYLGADKSLARLGRKEATATKPKKKKIKNIRPTRSPRQEWPPRGTKNGDLSILFSVGSG